ncbi:MAG: cold shock domain-containing protein [bacterium]|nr:cold shock domain-containing protein [bacterium]
MASSSSQAPLRSRRWVATTAAAALVALAVAVPMAQAATSAGDYLDTFQTFGYSGSQGSLPWTSPWLEVGDDGNAWLGSIRVEIEPHCANVVCLTFSRRDQQPGTIARSADLTSGDTATLTYDHKRHEHAGTSEGVVRLEVSATGTGGWTLLREFTLDTTDASNQPASHDLTPWISPTTTIRFELIGATNDSHLNIDNVRIELFRNDNVAPVLDPIADQTIDEEAPFAFTATASDDASNSLTFALDGTEPTGAFMTAGGDFTWTPTEAQGPGTYSFDVVVSDDGTPALSDSQTVNLTVAEVNAPPTLDPIGPHGDLEGTQIAFVATASDVETPTNLLVFSLAGGPPSGATISANGSFAWTPTEAQGPGSYTFDVVVTDNGAPARSDSEPITVSVTERNEAPTIAPIADTTIAEGTTLAFQVEVTDPDTPANGFTYTLSGAPAAATVSPTGMFTWETTDADGPGSHTFDVVVTDDGTPARSDTETLTVTVTEANIAPQVNPINPLSVAEGSPVSFVATAVDIDSPPNSFDFSLSGEPAGAEITAGGAFTWTPSEAQGPGVYYLNVLATDDGVPPMVGSTQVQITVTEVNSAPVLNPITSRTIDEGRLFTLQAHASDIDAPDNSLTFSLIGGPDGSSISSSGFLSWTPNEAQGPGTHIFQIVVSDNGSPELTDSQTVTIHVIDANNAPVIDPIGIVDAIEGQLVTFTATAIDPDVPANGFTFTTSGAVPAEAEVTPAGVFTWTPGETDGPGAYTFDIMVTDDGSPARSSYESVTIVVVEANQAPVLDALSKYEVEAGVPFLHIFAATDPDLPVQSLSYTASGLPEGATMADTGELRWTPSITAVGDTHRITIKATDNGAPALSDSATITLSVITANLAPVLERIGDQEVVAGSLLTFTARASDADGPADDLRFSLAGDVPVGAIIDQRTGAFSWRPSLAQNDADHVVDVIVTDRGGVPKSDSETITITVGRPNVPPVITRPANQSHVPGEEVDLVVGSADPDAYPSPLIHSAENLPPGLSIDEITGAISGKLGFDGIAGSPYSVTVSVSDGDDTASTVFTWAITGIADPGTPSPTRGAVVNGITAIASPVVVNEAEGTLGRSLVLMSRAARASVSEMSAPLLLLLLIVGAFIAFGRVGLVPMLRRGTKHDGVLRRLDLDTGAGLVHRSSDGADVFVHVSAVARRDRATLIPGDLVTFRTVDGAYRDLVTKLRRR